MIKTFINFSNQHSSQWSRQQLEEGYKIGQIIDIAFPEIPPEATATDIIQLADQCLKLIMFSNPYAVLVQGESSLSYSIIKRLRIARIRVLCASLKSKKVMVNKKKQTDQIQIVTRLGFVRFREYV